MAIKNKYNIKYIALMAEWVFLYRDNFTMGGGRCIGNKVEKLATNPPIFNKKSGDLSCSNEVKKETSNRRIFSRKFCDYGE
jgi:hypothetical protein